MTVTPILYLSFIISLVMVVKYYCFASVVIIVLAGDVVRLQQKPDHVGARLIIVETELNLRKENLANKLKDELYGQLYIWHASRFIFRLYPVVKLFVRISCLLYPP